MRYLRLLAVIVFLVVLVTLPYPGQTRQAAAPAEPVALASSKRFDVSTARTGAAEIALDATAVTKAAGKERHQTSKVHLLPEAFDR